MLFCATKQPKKTCAMMLQNPDGAYGDSSSNSLRDLLLSNFV